MVIRIGVCAVHRPCRGSVPSCNAVSSAGRRQTLMGSTKVTLKNFCIGFGTVCRVAMARKAWWEAFGESLIKEELHIHPVDLNLIALGVPGIPPIRR